MSDIEYETEKWDGQISDEWRRDTIYWLRATPNEDLRELVDEWKDSTDTATKVCAEELEELINNE